MLHGSSELCGAGRWRSYHAERYSTGSADVAATARSAEVLLLCRQVGWRDSIGLSYIEKPGRSWFKFLLSETVCPTLTSVYKTAVEFLIPRNL